MTTPRFTLAGSPRCLAAALLGLAGLAQANDTALNQCRQESVAAKRLACYDAIPTRATAATPAPAPTAAAAAPSGTTALAPAPAAPAVAQPASRFGLPSSSEEAVDSRITGRFEGWGPKTRFTLANGQVWEVEDGTNASLWLDSPPVRVRRGFTGAFFLEIDGTNRSPRVRRLQ